MFFHVIHKVVQKLNFLLNSRWIGLKTVVVFITVKIDVMNVAARIYDSISDVYI